jgi:hypothetical protein
LTEEPLQQDYAMPFGLADSQQQERGARLGRPFCYIQL